MKEFNFSVMLLVIIIVACLGSLIVGSLYLMIIPTALGMYWVINDYIPNKRKWIKNDTK